MNVNKPISKSFSSDKVLRSFEFFPPKDDAGTENLKIVATALQRINPDFVSVTYGAGGTTRNRTSQVCDFLKNDFNFNVMPHLTCVGHSRHELCDIADKIYNDGFRNIMTLRGDPPKGESSFTQYKDGLRYASDLVSLLKSKHSDFCLGVGGYPEKHPEAKSIQADIDALKEKVDAGADFITTQLFFENSVYYRFVDRCRAAKINVPIIPGIMPVLSLKQIQRFSDMCGTSIPKKLITRLEATGDNTDVVEMVGVDWALSQLRDLISHGTNGYHLYILNRPKAALAIAANLSY